VCGARRRSSEARARKAAGAGKVGGTAGAAKEPLWVLLGQERLLILHVLVLFADAFLINSLFWIVWSFLVCVAFGSSSLLLFPLPPSRSIAT
jgi:hypothetical protein